MGEMTSCRGTVQSAWLSTSTLTQSRDDWAARKGKWSPRGTETTAFTCPCPTASRVSVAVRECARVAGKGSGENGPYSAAGQQLTLDNKVGPVRRAEAFCWTLQMPKTVQTDGKAVACGCTRLKASTAAGPEDHFADHNSGTLP